MTSDPLRELADLLDESQIDPDQPLPRIISAPCAGSGETDERGWVRFFGEFKIGSRMVGTELWQIVIQWFDSWFRTVLTGIVIGALSGFLYRWISVQ